MNYPRDKLRNHWNKPPAGQKAPRCWTKPCLDTIYELWIWTCIPTIASTNWNMTDTWPAVDSWPSAGTTHTFDDNFTSSNNLDNGFTNGGDNHDSGDFGGMNGGGDRLCFNCNQPGHNKSECTAPRAPREFTGECRDCGMTG